MEYLSSDREQFKIVIDRMISKSTLEPGIIEKDYYVSMILKGIAEKFDFSVFKGGTSLQKCHRVISRFSEDIDITIDSALSQGKKRKLKYGIVDIASELGMSILNLDDTRSRNDYNKYELKYDSVLDGESETVQPVVILETSFTEVSFPTVVMPVHSYIGDFLAEEAPDILENYGLIPFDMKVQGLDRTLVDKVFAICDYYMNGRVKKHSRHIYDIYKILPLVPQDEEFRKLVNDVREVRSKKSICPSAMPGINIPEMLEKIIEEKVYKDDYDNLTSRLLEERVSYDDAIAAVKSIAISGMFSG